MSNMPNNNNDANQVNETDVPNYLHRYENYQPEMTFSMSGNTTLHLELELELNNLNNDAIEYLSHKVTREPSDLRSHIQIINLYMQSGDPEQIYGAILDLFIALTNKGFSIRQRMLQQACFHLDPAHYDALNERLESGIQSHDIMPISRYSVLSNGLIGAHKFFDYRTLDCRKRELPSEPIDPVQQARDFLEYDHINEARILLEQAILKEPWRKDIHSELLNIYWVTRDNDNCQTMYQLLAKEFIPDHSSWINTTQRLNSQRREVSVND